MVDITSAENLRATIAACTGRRVVAYYPGLAQVCGGVKAAILLSQLLFWSEAPFVRRREGWVYKSVEELFVETGLSKAEQRTARHELAFRGLVEARLKGIPRTWFYRVDVERLKEACLGPNGVPVRYPPDEEQEVGKWDSHPGNENLPNVEPAGTPTRDKSLTNIGAGDERPSRENRDNNGEESKPILSEVSAQLNRNQRIQQRLLQKRERAAGAAALAPEEKGAEISKSPNPDGEDDRDPGGETETHRTVHPAIALVGKVTGRCPVRPTYARVIAVLGEQPDEARLTRVFEAWCLQGFKPANLEGVLDWYRDGIPSWVGKPKGREQDQPKGPSLPPSTRTAEEVAEIRARLREARERMEKRNQEETGG